MTDTIFSKGQADRPFAFGSHRRAGNFLLLGEPDALAGYHAAAETIALQDSQDMSTFFELGEGRALGTDRSWMRYRAEFQAAGWQAPLSEFPMAIWNLVTGKRETSLKGNHFGQVRGASYLDSKTLLTWGRDYMARWWDTRTGELVATLPLPLWANAHGAAVLDSRRFGTLSGVAQRQYIETQNLPAPNVRIEWIVEPGGHQQSYACPRSKIRDTFRLKKWVPGLSSAGDHFSEHIFEMAGAELGYSTSFTLADGRLLAGGTTYGTSGYVYVWDGLFDLTILIPCGASINFHIEGEITENVIEMYEVSAAEMPNTYTFKI